MSVRIACPHCGTRSLEEYVYGEMFSVPETIVGDSPREIDRSFMHNNAAGPVREAWYHLYGCRRWIVVTRDTTTDQILEVE